MSAETAKIFMLEVNKMRTENIKTWLDYVYNSSVREAEKRGNDTVSLINFIDDTRKTYIDFKDEYNEKCTLDIGENNDFESFENKTNRKLILYINTKPGIKNQVPWPFSNRLVITEFFDGYQAMFTRNYLRYIADFDQDILKNYLDVFQKYNPLFRAFNYINGIIPVGSNKYLELSFDAHNDSFINNLDGINIKLYDRDDKGNRFFINIYVDLKEETRIDYDKSFMKVQNNIVLNPDLNIFDEILNNLCVDVKDLKYPFNIGSNQKRR